MNLISNLFRLSLIFGWSLLICSLTQAQQHRARCGAMAYDHHNQIDYTLRVTSVRGTARTADGDPISRACAGIFTESGDTLVAATAVGEDGMFQIVGLPNGRYRLVVAGAGFCAANAIIVLRNKRRGKKLLVVTIKPMGIDDCSYIDVK